MGPEVDGIAHILRLGEDVSDDIAAPVIGAGEVGLVFPHPNAAPGKVDGGRLDLILKEHPGNLIRPVTLDSQTEDPAHDSRRFLVDDPAVLVVGNFLIPVYGAVGGAFAGFTLDADSGFLLAAEIAQIPLVHDVQERDELIAGLVVAVYVVGDGDEVYPVLPEHDLRIKAGLQVVPADS